MSDRPPDADRRAVCAGCGCLCDDVRLEDPPFRPGRPNVETDCERGRRWFARRVFGASDRERRPAVDGEPARLDESARRAAELLAGAVHPRVEGLERLPLGAQRKLVEIADRAGAAIDSGASPDHLSSVLAVHRDGGAFVTLGEIRQRVDCLVLWYVQPSHTHPRLLERFYPRRDEHEADGAAGTDRTGARPDDRTLVAVGPRAGESDADVAVSVEPERSLELLWLVRLLADDPSSPERGEHPLGGVAARLLETLRAASCGAWVFDGSGGHAPDGPGAASGPGAPEPDGATGTAPGPVETSGLLRLLDRLNDDAPWGTRPLRGEGNPAGAEAVLTWQSGFPAAVSYRSGRPDYAGPAHAAGRAGAADRHDVVLAAGGDPASLPRDDGTAVVWLDAGAADDGPGNEGGAAGTSAAPGDGPDPGGRGATGPGAAPAVRLPVLPAGARAGDTLLRMDGLSVRSPGIPGGDDGDAVPAEEALEAVLRELERIRTEETA